MEKISLEKFQNQELKKETTKFVFGGDPTCTGGGFNLVRSYYDMDGHHSTWESWDSDEIGYDGFVSYIGYEIEKNVTSWRNL